MTLSTNVRRLGVATLAGVLTLAACGGDDDDAASDTVPTEATAEESATETTTPQTTAAPTTAAPATTEAPTTTAAPATTEATAEETTAEESTAEASGDEPAACAPYIEVTLAFSGEPDPTSLTGWLDELDADPPSDITEALGVMTSAARSVLDSGGEDFSAFEAPEFAEAQAEVDPWMFENCEFDQKEEVTAADYSFEGLEDTYEAGRLALLLTNEGNEAHEVAILRKAEGTTETWEELLALPEEEAMTKAESVGGAFAPTTGSQGLAVLDLVPGEYIALCFVPTGTVMGEDGEFVEGSGPPHFMQGMQTEFTVS